MARLRLDSDLCFCFPILSDPRKLLFILQDVDNVETDLTVGRESVLCGGSRKQVPLPLLLSILLKKKRWCRGSSSLVPSGPNIRLSGGVHKGEQRLRDPEVPQRKEEVLLPYSSRTEGRPPPLPSGWCKREKGCVCGPVHVSRLLESLAWP